MSEVLIQKYLNQLRDLQKVSGTSRESVVREAFKDLLKDWARAHDLVFIPEYEITRAGLANHRGEKALPELLHQQPFAAHRVQAPMP